MPKGRVEPREVVCRDCGNTFVSDRPGKASWFCHNPCGPTKKVYVPVDQTLRVQERAAREERRRQEHASQVASRAADRARARTEREAQRKRDAEQRRHAKVQERLRKAREKERAREARLRASKVERLTARRDGLTAELGQVDDELAILGVPRRESNRELAPLDPLTPATSAPEFLLRLKREATAADTYDFDGRLELRKKITSVARAEGINATRDAVWAMLVVGLAWWRQLDS